MVDFGKIILAFENNPKITNGKGKGKTANYQQLKRVLKPTSLEVLEEF